GSMEGLNVCRARGRGGGTLHGGWAPREPDAGLRAGPLIIAEREATHARLLAERMRALGAEPAPACVDDVLAEQMAELAPLDGFIAQLDGLKRCTERDKPRMVGCEQALARA